MYSVWLIYIGGRKKKRWRVAQELEVLLSSGNRLTIPVGFETDLSSVPKLLWSIFPPFGDFLIAPIVHDYLYVNKIGTRASADKEMLYQSNLYNSNKIDNYIRYVAVRLFGWTYWCR